VPVDCRTTRDRSGNTVRDKKPLIGPPFLVLCDFLMHRALFCSKTFYEQKVSAETRQAFLDKSRETHTAEGARDELQDCWKNHIKYRLDRKMQIAYGLPAGTALFAADGLSIEDPADEIARMEAEEVVPASAAADGDGAVVAGGGGGPAAAAAANGAVAGGGGGKQ
jgi:hypothetical protein